ncbi:MAG: hypothetical protein ABJB74_21080 [Gemmatimonas sp.]
MDDSANGPEDTGSSDPVINDGPDQRGERDYAPPPRQSFKRRNWGKLLLFTLVMFPVAAFGIWTAVTLNWTYSEGPRPGYVQKISRKGFVCKTWEGILYTDLKGFRSDSFQFTVRDDSIARLLQGFIGRQVSVDYQQHVNVPTSCFGESEYFVIGVHELK